MARAANGTELTRYRTSGKWSKLYAAILKPPIVYRARINQTFSSLDQVLSITYDTATGVLADVLPDMEVWVGSSVDSYNKGICRLRDRDGTKFYVSETSEIAFADNDYITIVANFGLWARPVRITTAGVVYMDETLYSNQHANWDPMPNMGPHKVAELSGATVDVGFDASTSFCPGSSISTYAWSCSTASASAGTSTSTATFQFNVVGWHIVYLTLTAANGKSFFGVRYVYIWNETNPPPLAEISDPGKCDVDSGGWSIGITLRTGATLSDIYERALVVLFSKDYYGSTQDDIGPVAGAENIRFIGWISSESLHMESEQNAVSFVANGSAFWMTKIPSWPDGVEFVSGTPSHWTSIASLTVDLGVYHFLRWRSTITRVSDVTLTGDTRLTQEVSSSAQNLWSQLQEMTWNQIYARPGVNALNQLSIQIHPNLIPTGSRTYPTVMTITYDDIADGIDFDRAAYDEVGIVDMSGVIVTAPSTGTAKFALSPGHSLPHHGDWDLQTNLLLSSQSQVITLSGLYRSWRNNKYKNIPLSFAAPVSLIDCFPNQKCYITINAADNARGVAYSGGLIPISVTLNHDPQTGYLHTEVTFEAETFESQAMQGDTPGSGSTDSPPSPTFPPIPLPPISIPGIPTDVDAGGPKKVIFLDGTGGLIYCENFNEASPTYVQINAGLGVQPWGTYLLYQRIERFYVTPSGSIYVTNIQSLGGANWEDPTKYAFVYGAPYPGGTFSMIYDSVMLGQPSYYNRNGIYCVGVNDTLPDSVFIATMSAAEQTIRAHVGSLAGGFNNGYNGLPSTGGGDGTGGSVSYGNGRWVYLQNANFVFLNADGTSMLGSGSDGNLTTLAFNGECEEMIRASTTPIVVCSGGTTYLVRSTDNLATRTVLSIPDNIRSGVGMAIDFTGNNLMARWGSGSKGKSTDGGYSWSALPNLPNGNWYFQFAGMNGGNTTWIAAGAVIRFSPDGGNTWLEKTTSSLTAINPFPNIYGIKVLEY